MFNKQMIISTIAVAVTTMVYGFVVFANLMTDFYMANAGGVVVRPAGTELMEWMSLAQVLIAYGFVWVWSHDVKNEGLMEGVRFGFFMGLFWGGVEMINYALMPMVFNVMVVGYILDIVMFMVAGGVLAMVWPKLASK